MSWRTPRENEKGVALHRVLSLVVIPAKAGIQVYCPPHELAWIPACAGMTEPEARRFICQERETDIFQGVFHELAHASKE